MERRYSFGAAEFWAFLLIGFALAGCRTSSRWTDLSAPEVWSELEGPAVAVVSDEGPLPVVTDEAPANYWAAWFLVETIEETTGRRPLLYVEKPERRGQTPAKGLFVGSVRANDDWSCPLAAENAEAFRVVASDGCVRFLGRADYAVFDWCERVLGVRYYCADGKCVEKRASVIMPAVDYADRPVYSCRLLGWQDPLGWLRFVRHGNAHRGGVNVHQPARWFADEKVKSEAPDIFETGTTPMLCYGNPHTLAYYQYRIDRHIAGLEDSGGIVDTNRQVVSVSPWDAPIRCACQLCRNAYDEKSGFGGRASPIVWGRFTRRLSAWLASAHPGYRTCFLPYLNFVAVPAELLPRRRSSLRHGRNTLRDRRPRLTDAEAEVCTMPGLALLKDPSVRAREERLLRDWHRATGRKVLSWHYSCWPKDRTSAPYVYGRTVRQHCAAMTDDVCGMFICGDPADASQALSHYVWMKCLWNPDLDVEAVYDEFARRMFGAGAAPMRELIRLQEDGWERPWTGEACTYGNVFETSYPRSVVQQMRVLLTEAHRLAMASGDLTAARRIVRYAEGFVDFFGEADTLSARGDGRPGKPWRKIRPGETNEMVTARSVWHPTPWARTTVVTTRNKDELVFTVRCEEPAASAMDFVHEPPFDYVRGRDCVIFDFAGGERHTVHASDVADADESARAVPPGRRWETRVTHDDGSWTAVVRMGLTPEELKAGRVLGNVSRWRVGDRRLPEERRVPGSRYEQSRLNTLYTHPNDDPAAFVVFQVE